MTIKELEQKIIDASQAYYSGEPIMSDTYFDGLVEYLKQSNPNSEILKKTGWGFDPFKEVGEKQNHLYGNVVGIDRKPRSIENIPKDFLNKDVCLSAKLDGLSMVCYFVNGKLTKALTRGNGSTGINRTDKVLKIVEKEFNIPDNFDFTGAIRGEICISNKNWSIMQEQNLAGSNQRNTATGIINKDEITSDINFLDLIFYKVVGYKTDNNLYYNTLYEENVINANKYDVKFLRKFIKPEYIVDYIEDNGSKINQDDLENLFNSFNKNYLCDGIVITKKDRDIIRLNSDKISINNNEIAYKFITETAVATINNIKWKMSKNNKAIPVINVEPIELSGAIIQNATAFNAKYIYDNDLDIGAKIELVRSGEVIPYITSVVQGVSTAKEKIDCMTCPYCRSKLEWDGVDLVCKNKECKNRDYQNLRIWVTTLGQVDGISETLIFKFLDELNINSLDELYLKDNVFNTYEDLAFSNVLENSHKGKFNKVLYKLLGKDSIDFDKLLIALNIKQLGQKNAEKLASHLEFPLLFQKFIDTGDSVIFINECYNKCENAAGPALIDNICSFDGLNKLLNARYVRHRINFNINKVSNNLIPVVITGKLSVPRKEFEKYLLDNGYEVKSSINKNIKYLITDNPNSGSNKNLQADKLGITKITESNFRDIIEKENDNYSKSYIL